MKATPVIRRRIVLSEQSFAEIIIWEVPGPVRGSAHRYKYRLAHVVRGTCVMRFDNEAGKGDHIHKDGTERGYEFSTIDQLLADFFGEVARTRS